MSQVFGVFGHGLIKNNALLQAFLQSYLAESINKNVSETSDTTVKIQRIFPLISQVEPHTIMLGWGRKKSYRRASQFAQRHDLPMLTLEDGFLRSLTSGKHSRYACSMVIDPIGIYFNAKYPSYLEQLIVDSALNPPQLQKTQRLIDRIISERLSKYNGTAKNGTLSHLKIQKDSKNILLIDQVAGDQSINGAGADKDSFIKMLKIAQQNHPKAQLWIKAHPAGKIGYLTEIELPNAINIIQESVNPIELLEQMDDVYTVSSHMGFEALMLGKPVHCFGVPWYAGWGLTDDTHAPQNVLSVAQTRRLKRREKNGMAAVTLGELFFACYLQYSHYANPATGKACDIDTTMDWLVTNRAWKDTLHTSSPKSSQSKPLLVYEVSGWKYSFVQAFFASGGKKLVFKALPKPHAFNKVLDKKWDSSDFNEILVWGFAKKRQIRSRFPNQQIWCMEDGFIRSNGLGASLIEPLSVVVDKTGIYYNATTPNDLEILLANQNELSQTQLDRVNSLQQRLLSQHVSKYNVGKAQPLELLISAKNKEKILVVGQVEDDMSVQLCGSEIKTNLGLLRQVRHDNPNAFILYKPHPDVQAGLRTGKISDTDMAIFADQIVPDIRIAECLDQVDSVHTISSLTGFEALLRSKKVTCYGLPFYAGWGLTVDKVEGMIAIETLKRRAVYRTNNHLPALNVSQLTFATLIKYPLYHLPNSYGLAQVEEVIDFLYDHPSQRSPTLTEQLTTKRHRLISQAKLSFMQKRQQLLNLSKHPH